jgi:excisionase family DNA binding protein
MNTLLTTKQVQAILKIDRITVYRMLNDGRLKGVKVGNQWRFPQSEIDHFLGEESETEEVKETVQPISDFPVDCAQRIQEIFAGIIGIGALTVSLQGDPLTDVNYANPFCKLMLSNPESRQACQASWRKVAIRATGEPPFINCHAGLSYIRSVIQMDDRPAAMLISGQYYLNPPDPEREAKRLEDLSIRYQIPLSQLKDAATRIPILKRSQQDLVQEWAPKVAMAVQSMICERSDLMARLQRIASLSNIQQSLPHSQNSQS